MTDHPAFPRLAPTLSVVVITYNAGAILAGCLRSVQWADEIIVVDAESTDETLELARGLAHRVVSRPWTGFSDQKNFGASLARGDWILHLDADERVPPALGDQIRRAISASDRYAGYFIPRRNFWLGHWIRHGGWYPDWSLRLYRHGSGHWEGLTHERLVVDGRVGKLSAPLDHFSYRSVQEHVERMVLRSAPLEAREAVERGLRVYAVFPFRIVGRLVVRWISGRPTALALRLLYKEMIKNRVEIAWLMPLAPVLRFLYMYVLRLGFLDGFPGFWVATLSAFYEAVRVAKIWEHFSTGPEEPWARDRRPVWEQSSARV